MEAKKKIIFHVDMDAFFASCMQAKHPHLKNKVMVVANSGKHSIISAASYQARALGIKAAMNLFQARKIYPDLVTIEPDFGLFNQTSQKIWEIISQIFCLKMEVASIDECYLDVTDAWSKYGSPQNMAKAIQQTIIEKLDLTCSIGISYTKFLAKMGTDMNKPNGITIIRPNNFQKLIWPLPIKSMLGVGISTNQKLIKLGVKTIEDIALISSDVIYSKLGNQGLVLKNNALGIGDNYVKWQSNELKSISNEITLDNSTSDYEELEAVLAALTKHVLLRLNKRVFLAKTVDVRLRYKWFNQAGEGFDQLKHLSGKSKQITLANHTNNFEIIYANVLDCFYQLFEQKREIVLIGVGVANLINAVNYGKQLSFDDPIDDVSIQQTKNQDLINLINQNIGQKKLLSAQDLLTKKDKKPILSQGKFLGDLDTHLSNEEIKNKWKNKI